MRNTRKRVIFTITAATLFFSGLFAAQALNSDFGRVAVTAISIPGGDKTLSGLLYQPNSASVDQPAPAVVLAHGIGGSKEMMSSIGLELARRGFVAFCLDLYGHGQSEGAVADGRDERSFGVLSAVHYLETQTFVNASAIGLVGHSLGGGAARAAAAQGSRTDALVLIAGGLGDVAGGPAYATLNQTFPKNLLVVIGKYDVLFNLTDLTARELPPVFGSQDVVPGVFYGSFQSQTARKLVVPATTHLFEPVDPIAVREIVAWMEQAFVTPQPPDAPTPANMVYLAREAVILAVLAGLFGLVFSAYSVAARSLPPRPKEWNGPKADSKLKGWTASAVWGVLNLSLFVPMFSVGFVVSFPPLIFGASIAWWLLATGLAGGILLARTAPKCDRPRTGLQSTFLDIFDRNSVLVALVLFTLLFVIASLVDGVFNISLGIVSPIFRAVASARRGAAFLAFMPFFLTYFTAEGFYLHGRHEPAKRERGAKAALSNYGKAVFSKIVPFAALVLLAYMPKALFGIWILPSFVGFLVEFLWLIMPIFIVTTTCSWWFYRNTGNVATGVVFNAVMLAWVASVVFPF